ncbi:hypothetical protein [Salinisphaera sp. G21_0]|uniref:hypothetical protein n=1 Tax=Salinisphaera sp. G21_0 TaxID=2821094 RepID=UPI001AD977C9|nr:hypothetical protein [Salinisphaera sp. G21_0]MBO9480925.1 hypothetical protein [Salinisphaera sp. G21_0]
MPQVQSHIPLIDRKSQRHNDVWLIDYDKQKKDHPSSEQTYPGTRVVVCYRKTENSVLNLMIRYKDQKKQD